MQICRFLCYANQSHLDWLKTSVIGQHLIKLINLRASALIYKLFKPRINLSFDLQFKFTVKVLSHSWFIVVLFWIKWNKIPTNISWLFSLYRNLCVLRISLAKICPFIHRTLQALGWIVSLIFYSVGMLLLETLPLIYQNQMHK